MNNEKVRSLLQGIAAINRILKQETEGNDFFFAVTDRFEDTLIMAGTGLQRAFYATADTDEMPAVVCENFEDTAEFPPIIVYDKFGNEVAS